MSSVETTIALLPDEYWWGGIVRHGNLMPFGAQTEITEHLYQNLFGNQGCPLLVSSKGRYIWSDEPFSYTFSHGEITIFNVISPLHRGEGHDTLKGAYCAAAQRFFPPSGRVPHELCFSAPQYNSWIDVQKYPTQEKVLAYADAILDSGMPPGVFMIDDWWYRHNGFWEFDSEAFPDPKAMTDTLHRKGFAVVLWISPWVSADTRLYGELSKKGYLLRVKRIPQGDDLEFIADEEIKPAIQSWWNGHSGVLDLSNPEAFEWLQGQLDHLVSTYGIDGFKFDGGDAYRYLPNYVSLTPRTPNGHCEDFGRIGLKYPIAEYRACWKLGGQHLLQRVRDKAHKWEAGGLADTIPTSLVHGLVGYPYTCPDMVGGGELNFSGGFDQELFIRWAQSAMFFPIIQFSLLPSRVLDDHHRPLCMEAVKLRQKLAPEIVALARRAAITGEPIMRHMEYEFPGEGMERITDQFMLGESILAAPVLTKGVTKRSIQFPSGIWEGDDGSTVSGPCRIEVETPLTRIPWYRKKM